MNEYIKSDLYRYAGNTSLFIFIKEYMRNPAFRYMVAHRLVNSKGLQFFLGAVLWTFRNRQYIQIPKETQIGYGFCILHRGPIVINGTATIGDNCTFSQFTTIGSNHRKAATIGNNVYMGPGVSVVENVVIGDNAIIGAGSVVTKDIPSNATAAGNYAKVLHFNNTSLGKYTVNKWNFENWEK